ncbi:MAG TPA: aminotransferase class I/II-fold pyridoxal phosphate-dependent enzyme [bacterium]|nr:aminotransferase class I/II-fold pyridoxal phosphate-dependent enzyme [bacterium]
MAFTETGGPRPATFIEKLDVYSPPKAPAPTDLKLDSNEGVSPPLALLDNLPAGGPELFCRYQKADRLEALIADDLRIDPSQVLITAGCDDAIQRCCRVFLSPDREMILPYPTFEMYRNFAILAGGKIVDVPWTNGRFPTERIIAAVTPQTGIVTVITPNNPTGETATAADLERLSSAMPEALLVVDLAYTQFADDDLTDAALHLPNAIALHTFSKAWGMAGLRVGFAAGPAQLIHYLRRAGLPFPVSNISLQLAADWYSAGRQAMNDYVKQARSERKRMQQLLIELGFATSDSQGNFIFVLTTQAPWLRDALAGLGIAVRLISAERDFPGGLRITCPGDEATFRRLAHALRTIARPQAIIFDMDGVLADDSQSYRQAVVDTAKTYGIGLTTADVTREKARGDANNEWIVTQRLLAAHSVRADLAEVTERFEVIYQGTDDRSGLWTAESLLIEKGWLKRLAARLPLAIVTGRPRHDAERFLHQHGIAELFQTVVCMEDAPLKPDPAPVRLCLEELNCATAWMIGDTPDDIQASRRAGVLPLGVVSPADDRATIEPLLYQAGAARVLQSLAEVEDYLP